MQWLNRLVELMEDWMFLIRRDGCQSGLAALGRDIACLPYRHLHFSLVARTLTEPLPDLRPKISFDIRPFAPGDVDLLREIDRPSEARASARRLRRGHIGLIAFCQGQAAGYAWSCTEVDPMLERVKLELQPGDVLFSDSFTVSALRGEGLQAALALERFRYFRERGYRRAIAYIEMSNAPSLAVWRKVGSREIGRLDFLRIGPWRWTRRIK